MRNIMLNTPMKTLNIGQLYNLTEIFTGKYTKIIIPDLQRDYCWGGKGRLVQDFLENIIEKGYRSRVDLSMGLLYGYEEPYGHIQLCDGQQRITTLFLLIGMLNKECSNQFRNLLISDFEYYNDDKEPYMQYAIRESSLYFLSDLVCEFFLESEGEPNDIRKQCWYFGDYDNDPSIRSMLNALQDIHKLLASPVNRDIDKSDLARYVTQNLWFMYYDMGTRSLGEETFVIINTTGEPLSPTENLKPRYVTKYPDSSDMWEKWEQWFWMNRNRDKNDTADNGLLEFLRWVIVLETKDVKEFEKTQESLVKQSEVDRFDFEPVLRIEPQTIDQYFNVVKKLFNEALPNNKLWLSPERINSQIDWLRILPLIAYSIKFPNAQERDIVRVKHFFKNIAQLNHIRKDIGRVLSYAVEVIRLMVHPDIAHIIYIENISDQLLTEEERLKFTIFLESENRIEIEDAFWKIQYKTDQDMDGKIWNGEILPILKWSFVNDRFNFEEFKKYMNVFYEVFKGECDGTIDLTRRALITCELKDYPKYFKGQTNKSFGWDYNDFKVLINENVDKFFEFFKKIVYSEKSVLEVLAQMCDSFPIEKPWAEFVHIPDLLAYCNEKNIQWWGDEQGWILVKDKYTSGRHANVNTYKFYLELSQLSEKFWEKREWKLWFYEYGNTCTVFDNDISKMAIDIKCLGNTSFIIEVFMRSKESDIENDLSEFATRHGLIYNGSRYVCHILMKNDVVEKLKSML